jgi:hypothetical protein
MSDDDMIRALPAVQPDLTDPNVVHANMLRGTIAKPTVDQIRHIYGDDLPNAAAILETALREAADSLLECSVWCDSQERTDGGWHNGVMDARKYHMARILDLIDTRKEVTPLDPQGSLQHTPRSDIGPGDQAVAGAAHPPAVPFGAQPGTKIVFHGIGGYEAENEKARSVLQVGSTYTLLELDVGGWRSSLSIKEASGMWFNTVMFQPEPVAGAAPVTVQEAAQDIEAIENSGRRWHGEDHRVVSVRWEPYKPDGQRQMKAKGRWQEQVGAGDYWRWQNCERPVNLTALAQKGDSHE